MSGSTISTSIGHTVTIGNANYLSPLTITTTGIVTPSAYGAVGVYGSTSSGLLTLVNDGRVAGGVGYSGPDIGGGGGSGGAGVDLTSSTMTNTGTITGGGGGTGGGVGGVGGSGGAGVDLTSGTMTNDGAIAGGSGGTGGSVGGSGGTGVDLTSGTMTNAGTISGGGGGTGGGVGSVGGTGGTGVDLTSGTMTNAGTISGGRGGSGGVVSGAAGDAVQFGTGVGTLVVESGAVFNGAVVANATVADVLAIGGTAAVTVAGIGTEYIGFTDFAFEAGSTGIFAGSLANAYVSGFGRGDGLLLSGFAAAARVATIGAGGILTLAGAGGSAGVDLTFAAAAIGDVVDLTTSANGTGISLDPHYLNQSINTGITLTASGTYQSAFTITTKGAVTPSAHGAVGVIGSTSSGLLTLVNDGRVAGGVGYSSFRNGGSGGNGVDLTSGILTNDGAITGGGGGYGRGYGGSGGAGVDLTSGTLTNIRAITGGGGGYGSGIGGSGGFGVELTSGTLTNIGAITGGGGGGGYDGSGGAGVDLISGILTNDGAITGGSGGSSSGKGGSGGAGVDLTSGTLTNAGAITGGGGGYGSGGGGAGVDLISGILTNDGTISGGSGGRSLGVNGAAGDAVQFGTGVGTLVVESGAVFNGAVVANAAVADVLEFGGTLAAGSVANFAGIGTSVTGFSDFSFGSSAAWDVSGAYTAFDAGRTISGFAQGDTLVLDGFGATSDTFVSGVGLELGNGTTEITLDIQGSFSTANFAVIDPPSSTTISLVSCFVTGTRILTPHGEIPVEALQAGDQVIRQDGCVVPITWIGHRRVNIARHPRPETVRPVLFMAGAICDGVPAHDLLLSPDHAVYLNGHLIPAKALINGATIRQVERRAVTYYHVELPDHAVLYAEGTPCESYLETGNRGAFANGGAGAVILHPDFAQILREQAGCAPFAEAGPVVEAMRERLLARAAIPTTDDPGLGIRYRAGAAVIESRSVIAGHLSADPRDGRRLGVKISSLLVGGREIPLDHPALTEGWHDVEADGRWTDGRAVVPAGLVGGEKVDVRVAAVMAYPVGEAVRRVGG